MNQWLRFCDKTPVEHFDHEAPDTDEPDGWVTFVLAVRSDGYLYEVHYVTETEPTGEALKALRLAGRSHLQTMIKEIPLNVIPNHSPEMFMRGVVYQNGDKWVEAVAA